MVVHFLGIYLYNRVDDPLPRKNTVTEHYKYDHSKGYQYCGAGPDPKDQPYLTEDLLAETLYPAPADQSTEPRLPDALGLRWSRPVPAITSVSGSPWIRPPEDHADRSAEDAPDWETLYVEESERYTRLSNETAQLRAGRDGLREALERELRRHATFCDNNEPKHLAGELALALSKVDHE